MHINRLNSYLDSILYLPLCCNVFEQRLQKFIEKDVEISYEGSSGKIESVSGRLDRFSVNRRDPRQNYNFVNLVLDDEDHLFVDGEKMPASLSDYTYGIIKSIKPLNHSQNKVNPDRNI